MRSAIAVAALLGLPAAAGGARADPDSGTGTGTDIDSRLHAGVNLRADPGAHPFRLTGGIDTGVVDIAVTLDPMVVFDDQFDADLLTTTAISDAGWGVVAGWRSTAIAIPGGRRLREKAVVGISAPLPQIGSLPLRARWAVEVATEILEHGAGMATEWIAFSPGRDVLDQINLGMFLTIEYGGAGH
ncbi:MAG TPA: hypothetical protein VK601_19755 [Kofleriaceae bacterium]|nr:hypothetical protein [Kofleriaceae bacterium]